MNYWYNSNILPKQLLNKFMCCYRGLIPISNSHYVTGRDIKAFSDMICIENQLSNITSSCKCFCNGFIKNFNLKM